MKVLSQSAKVVMKVIKPQLYHEVRGAAVTVHEAAGDWYSDFVVHHDGEYDRCSDSENLIVCAAFYRTTRPYMTEPSPFPKKISSARCW